MTCKLRKINSHLVDSYIVFQVFSFEMPQLFYGQSVLLIMRKRFSGITVVGGENSNKKQYTQHGETAK